MSQHPLFPCHTHESAPAAAGAAFDTAEKKWKMVPNLIRTMATSPALAEGYLTLSAFFDKTALTPVERQVVLLAVSRFNGCQYCMGVHSVLADMVGVPKAVTEALREDRPLGDTKLEALRRFTTAMAERRGWVGEAELQRFLEAGYTPQHVLDVVLGVGLKTLSNYTNHLAGTELDAAFAHRAWMPPDSAAA